MYIYKLLFKFDTLLLREVYWQSKYEVHLVLVKNLEESNLVEDTNSPQITDWITISNYLFIGARSQIDMYVLVSNLR